MTFFVFPKEIMSFKKSRQDFLRPYQVDDSTISHQRVPGGTPKSLTGTVSH